jgi:maleate isomerase
MFGWRKRIGFISPSVLEVIPYDFYRLAPEGIGLVGVTCNIEGWADDQYESALGTVDRLATYLASRQVDFIIHSGAPLVVSRGKGFDLELIERIKNLTGIPATTTVRAAIDGLHHLGIKSLVLASPFPEELNRRVADFLSAYGFSVRHTATLNVGFKELQNVPPSVIYRFASEAAAAAPEADGVYMPCPQWPVADVVDILERDIRKPVVASDPADFWSAFRELAIRDPIRGYGRLLASLAAEGSGAEKR